MSAEYESALSAVGVPYLIRGAERFFEREEVRRAVLLLRGAARAVADDTRTGPGADLVSEVREVLSGAGWDAASPPAAGRARERWESLSALDTLAADTAAADPAAGLPAFVAELAERSAVAHAPTADAVTLSSLHAAKGLEWDAVFLVGLHEGGMPLSHADTDEQVEEERRLLYVGSTRARRVLRCSWSASRTPGGRSRRAPSRFLDGIRPPDGDRPAAGGNRGPRGRPAARCRGCGRPLAPGEDGRCATCPPGYDDALFERLRAWRSGTARDAGVPAYVVLTDATLAVVAERRPASPTELVGVPGIGATKAARYGSALLAVVAGRDPLAPDGAATP